MQITGDEARVRGSRQIWRRFDGVRSSRAFRVVLPVVVFLGFFAAYRVGVVLALNDALLGSALLPEFHRWQTDSDFLITQRAETNLLDGPFSHQLSLAAGGEYTGQVGFGPWLLSLLSSLFGGGVVGTSVIHTVVAASSSAVATYAVLGARRLFSVVPAILVAIALLQPFPTFMALSIYWLLALKMVPALAIIALLGRRTSRLPVVAVVMFAATLPVILSGYEYVTMVVILPIAYLTYLAHTQGWVVKRFLQHVAAVLVGGVLAVGVTILIHIAQLSAKFGSIDLGLAEFVRVVVKRTGAGDAAIPEVYAESLASNPAKVLDTYLGMPIFGPPDYLKVPGIVLLPSLYTVGLLIVVCVAVILTRAGSSSSIESAAVRWQGAALAWVVGLLGALGWILLARPHSYIHTFINPVLWYLPTIPLGLALLWSPVVDGVRALRARPLVVVVAIAMVAALVVFIAYSVISRR